MKRDNVKEGEKDKHELINEMVKKRKEKDV